MIPGTLCDSRLFARQRRALRGVADVRVLSYQHLSAIDAQPNAQQWATGLLKVLPAKFSVLGFSLGGIWALELLRQAPSRIERIAMVASNAQVSGAASKRKARQMVRCCNRPAAPDSSGARSVLSRALPNYFHSQRALQRHTPLLHRMAADTPNKAALAQFMWAASRPSGLEALARFAGPVLIVSGAKDKLCPPTWQRAMQQAAQTSARQATRWLQLPRTGHFVPLESPAHLNHAIVQWIHVPQAPEYIAFNQPIQLKKSC